MNSSDNQNLVTIAATFLAGIGGIFLKGIFDRMSETDKQEIANQLQNDTEAARIREELRGDIKDLRAQIKELQAELNVTRLANIELEKKLVAQQAESEKKILALQADLAAAKIANLELEKKIIFQEAELVKSHQLVNELREQLTILQAQVELMQGGK